MKIGLEIHQQLDTGKLFCSCPCTLRDDPPSGTVRRRLRAVIGETGEMDPAALMEMQKDKCFVYEFYDDTTCLVELDEEPPQGMNAKALDAALQIAKLLDMTPVPRIQVMRKLVIDGSNPSGFQRTALIAQDGTLKTSAGIIRIETLCLEEEAARIIGKDRQDVFFRLDRQGIPLIEIATAPDISSPEQTKEVAQKLGMVLRSIHSLKRGIGTIRQDINISIPKGNRVEIKGAQELRLIPEYVKQEVARQESLVRLMPRLRKASLSKETEITSLFKNTQSHLLNGAIRNGEGVFGLLLKEGAGLMGTSLIEGVRLGTDWAQYAKNHSGIGGILHGDELPAYGMTQEEVDGVKKQLGVKKNDGYLIFVGQKDVVLKAIAVVRERHTKLKLGPPEEVRLPNPGGTTAYLRPLPGAARMYPETDVLPIVPDLRSVTAPETIDERIARYEKQFSLPPELSRGAVIAGIPLAALVKQYPHIMPNVIVDLLVVVPKEISKRFHADINASPHIGLLFPLLDTGRLTREGAFEWLAEQAKGNDPSIESYLKLAPHELNKEVNAILKGESLHAKAAIGKVMAKLRGRAEGKDIVAAVNEFCRS
ncbi:MAG: Glu-tRNA(Gln) amidotransferase subunit GatE [Nanoarchaeota archaeon]